MHKAHSSKAITTKRRVPANQPRSTATGPRKSFHTVQTKGNSTRIPFKPEPTHTWIRVNAVTTRTTGLVVTRAHNPAEGFSMAWTVTHAASGYGLGKFKKKTTAFKWARLLGEKFSIDFSQEDIMPQLDKFLVTIDEMFKELLASE